MVVFCTYCGRSFTREEHLDRHIRTHTAVKPFRCSKCYLGFSRSDQLQRHINIHDPNYVAESYPSTLQRRGRDRRTPTACQNCAVSKTKCDGSYPCARCVLRNTDCLFRQSSRGEKKASCYAKPPVTAKKASETKRNLDKSLPSTVEDHNESPSQQSAGLESTTKSPLSQKTTANSAPESTTLNVGIPDRDIVSQEQLIDLEDLLDIDWSSEFQHPVQGLPDDSGFEELETFGGHRLKRSTPQAEKSIDFDNVDQSFKFNPTHTSGILSSDQAKAKEQLIIETPDHEVSHSRLHGIILDCPENADWNAVPASIVDEPTRLYHDTALNVHTNPQAGLNPLSKSSQTDGNLFHFRNGRLDTLLRNLYNVLLTYSPASDGETSLELPYFKDGGSNSISICPEDMLEECIRTFALRFDRMFPLLENSSADVTVFPKRHTRLGSLLIITMVTQAISSMPWSKTTSETWMHLTQACSAPILQTIQPKSLSIDTEIVLHLCLIHAYQLLWSTPHSSDKGSLDTYYKYSSKVRGVYLDDHKKLTTNRGILPLMEGSSVYWSQWKIEEKKRRTLYCWVLVDLEVSVINGKMPYFRIAELDAPIPNSEELWRASSASQCRDVVLERSSDAQSSLTLSFEPASLQEAFQSFIDNVLPISWPDMNLWQLRLLLYPLLEMVVNCNQLRNNFTGTSTSLPGLHGSRVLEHTQTLLDEARVLLEKWHQIAELYALQNPECAVLKATLILYHLLFLETLIDSHYVDQVCQQHITGSARGPLPSFPTQLGILTSNSGLKHSMAILNLTQETLVTDRPAWWPSAISRAGLTVWTLNHYEIWDCHTSLTSGDFLNIHPNFGLVDSSNHRSRRQDIMTPAVNNILVRCLRIFKDGEASPEVQERQNTLLSLLNS